MESIIQVFRMNELSITTRVRVIKALGNAINNKTCMNVTDELVVELILALDPELESDLKNDDRYKYVLIKEQP